MAHHSTPDIVPILGRGRHRSMRKGACFMEMASYLAGERWSDHPSCTHPLLGELARDVNDLVSDRTRQRLAPMIPDVVGLNPADPRVDPWIARLAAVAALPVSPVATQRVAAAGLLRCESMLAQLECRPPGRLSPTAEAALAAVPHAADWAHRFVSDLHFPAGRAANRAFARRTGSAIVRTSVHGISQACVPEPEALLVDLLREAIDLCRAAAREGDRATRPVSASGSELTDH